MTRIALTLTHPQAAAIDAALAAAHSVYQNEYQRQRELYRMRYGCYPYWQQEHALVASRTAQALSAANRTILGI